MLQSYQPLFLIAAYVSFKETFRAHLTSQCYKPGHKEQPSLTHRTFLPSGFPPQDRFPEVGLMAQRVWANQNLLWACTSPSDTGSAQRKGMDQNCPPEPTHPLPVQPRPSDAGQVTCLWVCVRGAGMVTVLPRGLVARTRWVNPCSVHRRLPGTCLAPNQRELFVCFPLSCSFC